MLPRADDGPGDVAEHEADSPTDHRGGAEPPGGLAGTGAAALIRKHERRSFDPPDRQPPHDAGVVLVGQPGGDGRHAATVLCPAPLADLVERQPADRLIGWAIRRWRTKADHLAVAVIGERRRARRSL